MLWLQNPPWARWFIAIVITVFAIWTEFRPEPSVEHPFAIELIEAGDEIGPKNTEIRMVPFDLLEPVSTTGFATRAYEPGEPITAAGLADEPITAPEGWWALEIDLPAGVAAGADIQVVLLDTGVLVPGRVTGKPNPDPLSNGAGSVALPPEWAATVASAALSGRIAVLVKAG